MTHPFGFGAYNGVATKAKTFLLSNLSDCDSLLDKKDNLDTGFYIFRERRLEFLRGAGARL